MKAKLWTAAKIATGVTLFLLWFIYYAIPAGARIN